MTRPKAKQEEHWALMRELADTVPKGVRLHMSPKKITEIRPEQNPAVADDKPDTGFWYDMEGDWASWCAGNRFCFGRYYYALDIDFSDVLRIRNLKQFERFEKEYKVKPRHVQMMERTFDAIKNRDDLDENERRFADAWQLLNRDEESLFFNIFHMDWPRVAQKYKGIEIIPHLYKKRMVAKWYYTWDCASGVIWDVSAIKSFNLYARWDGRKKMFVRPS